MKSEKKIEMLRKKVGFSIYEESKMKDQIIINQEDIDKFYLDKKEKKEDFDLNFTPVIKEGVLQTVNSIYGQTSNVLFSSNLDHENGILIIHVKHFYSMHENPEEFLWIMEMKIMLKSTNGFIFKTEDEIEVEYHEVCTPESCVFEAQGLRKIAEVKNREVMTKHYNTIENFFRVMSMINYILLHPEIKEIEKKKTSYEKKTNNKNKTGSEKKVLLDQKKNSDDKPRIVALNGIRFVTKDEKVEKALVSRKKVRHIGCWSVRGHYRHYRNGKTVYIAPYEKGTGRKKQKIYKIQSNE